MALALALSSLSSRRTLKGLKLGLGFDLHSINPRYMYVAGGIAAIFAVYSIVPVVYRLWFHLLAGFPEPKLLLVALAATRCYESYVNLVCRDFPRC